MSSTILAEPAGLRTAKLESIVPADLASFTTPRRASVAEERLAGHRLLERPQAEHLVAQHLVEFRLERRAAPRHRLASSGRGAFRRPGRRMHWRCPSVNPPDVRSLPSA